MSVICCLLQSYKMYQIPKWHHEVYIFQELKNEFADGLEGHILHRKHDSSEFFKNRPFNYCRDLE